MYIRHPYFNLTEMQENHHRSERVRGSRILGERDSRTASSTKMSETHPPTPPQLLPLAPTRASSCSSSVSESVTNSATFAKILSISVADGKP